MMSGLMNVLETFFDGVQVKLLAENVLMNEFVNITVIDEIHQKGVSIVVTHYSTHNILMINLFC